MYLDKQTRIQLVIFILVAAVACPLILFGYIKAPALLGVGRYTVTVRLPDSAGLYERSNVTYRGVHIGEVRRVELTDRGVEAILSLNSDISVPSNTLAAVHSQSAVGEQYVEFVPRDGTSAPLKGGDVVDVRNTSVPPDISDLLDSINSGLRAIPRDDLKTVIDEGATAVGGLGAEMSRIFDGATTLSIDAQRNLPSMTSLIEQSGSVLDSQTETSDAIQAWAAHLANITDQLQLRDSDLGGVLAQGGPTASALRDTFEKLTPGLPVLLANLVNIADVGVVYQPAIEQLLVLIPQGVANLQGTTIANHNTEQAYKGSFLDFKLNVNLPPPCTTGFLPAQQIRNPSFEDAPPRPAGDIYCRLPQDSQLNVRGARNLPCLSVPGKRAPTVEMCESDEQYVPLNDGMNWKGDPNGTYSGQDIPQFPRGAGSAQPGESPAPSSGVPPRPDEIPLPPPVAAALYDPATGTYVGPDGQVYTQANLAQGAKEQTWQSMLTPQGDTP